MSGATVSSLFFAESIDFGEEFVVVADNRRILVWKVEEDDEGDGNGGRLKQHWEMQSKPTNSLIHSFKFYL